MTAAAGVTFEGSKAIFGTVVVEATVALCYVLYMVTSTTAFGLLITVSKG